LFNDFASLFEDYNSKRSRTKSLITTVRVKDESYAGDKLYCFL